MIAALMLDFDDSADFHGNTGVALGRPLATYPLMSARATGGIQRYYVVTASPPIKAVALQNDAVIIDPPAGEPEEPDTERLLRHGYRFIVEDLKADGETLECLVLLFSNAPAVTSNLIAEGLDALQAKTDLDSVVSVSLHNRLSPAFAKREAENGMIEPYAGAPKSAADNVWYPDWGVQILRPQCLEGKAAGQPPFTWLGAKTLPLKQWGGGPIDYQWQIPSLEYWLKKHGFSDLSASRELQPQPKLQPKSDRR